MIADIRRGVPSASAMARINACPNSHKAQKGYAEEETPESSHGTIVHNAIAGIETTLNAAQADTVERCQEQEARLVDEWAHIGDVAVDTIRETRLGMTAIQRVLDVTDASKATFVLTGQSDATFIQGNRALIIDFKSLQGDVPDALDNPQLVTLTSLTARRYNVDEVTTAIVQPLAGKPTLALFDAAAIHQAHAWVLDVLDREEKSTPADRVAGKHCDYCKARVDCPQWIAANDNAIEIMLPMVNGAKDSKAMWAAMTERASFLTDEELVGRYRGLAMPKAYPEVIKAEMIRRAETDPTFPFQLKEKKGRRSIEDVGTVFARANAHGVTPEAFTAECSLPLGALKDLLKKATGAKGKALDAINDEVLEGAVTFGAPTKELVAVQLIDNGEEEQE